MFLPRLLFTAMVLCLWTNLGAAQIKAPVPSADQGSYNPTLTAKEAVLTNWKLAISGIRAGKFVSDQIVSAKGEDYKRLAKQAEFAAKTSLLRYASSYWLFAMDETMQPIKSDVIANALRASRQTCTTSCATHINTLQAAFADISDALDQAAISAENASAVRQTYSDVQALAELFLDMAQYLESDAWHTKLSMTEAGLDGQEVAARIVGTMAVWRNVEPFVGLRNQEIDDSVNASINRLLRDTRRNTRGKKVLASDSKEIAIIKKAASQVASDLRLAAGLFTQG